MLRDTASFTISYAGVSNVVEQRRLAMINVTHDGDDRRTRRLIILVNQFIFKRLFDGVDVEHLDPMTKLLDNEGGRFLVNRLIDGLHFTQRHQRLHDVGGLHRHLL